LHRAANRFADRIWHVQLKNARYVDELQEYKLPFPEKAMLAGGGEREIDRWYWELDDRKGLVNVEAFYQSLLNDTYDGWVVIESDQSPVPASSTILNSWFVQNRLLKQVKM
jgi:inosose dehydratase